MADTALIIFHAPSSTAFTFQMLIHSSTTLIHFVHYIHGRTALIFVPYVHDYMKSSSKVQGECKIEVQIIYIFD